MAPGGNVFLIRPEAVRLSCRLFRAAFLSALSGNRPACSAPGREHHAFGCSRMNSANRRMAIALWLMAFFSSAGICANVSP